MGGTVDSVEQLLVSRADPSVCKYARETPLHYAALFMNFDTAYILLRYMTKPQLDVQTIMGDTVLHYAAGRGARRPGSDIFAAVTLRLGFVKTLIEAGVDISLKNKLGQTAEDVATSHGRLGVVRLLNAESARRAMIDAFVMGLHPRLGDQSIISKLDPGVIQLITWNL
mmetsp:Transcript_70156/g.166548  ORF Transcript_70156/g.166548 Transcript_70156/m.166548 type:complete len:169 (+) Transcript_70156:131-637(+)